jgi:hypothetical protein
MNNCIECHAELDGTGYGVLCSDCHERKIRQDVKASMYASTVGVPIPGGGHRDANTSPWKYTRRFDYRKQEEY